MRAHAKAHHALRRRADEFESRRSGGIWNKASFRSLYNYRRRDADLTLPVDGVHVQAGGSTMTDAISVLTHLADISRDGAKGFSDAADAVKSANLKTTLKSASERCEMGARELDAEISKLGGEPSSTGTIGGAMHRAWTNLTATVTGGDDKAILNECERGEDVAEAAYEEALQADLPMELKSTIRRQYTGVKENHDLIKRLRDAA
jgi:uncharacterized protein (TIGR02284 family)